MFEIPVSDIDRSIEFYQSVFEVKIKKVRLMEKVSAVIYDSSSSLSGLLVTSSHPRHSTKTIVIPVSSTEVMSRYLMNARGAGASLRTGSADAKNIHIGSFEDQDGNIINFLVSHTTSHVNL